LKLAEAIENLPHAILAAPSWSHPGDLPILDVQLLEESAQ
jgi:hypothetical protein